MATLPEGVEGVRHVWEKEERMRRFRMKQREDEKAAKAAAEAAAKAAKQTRYEAMCKAARKARRQHARQRRQELRFAQDLERQRLRTREEAGNRWVEKRMLHTAELESIASQIKKEKADERLDHMRQHWSRIEDEQLRRKAENRALQLERLRPLTALGTDVASLIVDQPPSPMMQRMSAIAHIHQSSAQKQRQDLHKELDRAKRSQRLADLSCTRQTAENRAEQNWLLEMEKQGLAAHGHLSTAPPMRLHTTL